MRRSCASFKYELCGEGFSILRMYNIRSVLFAIGVMVTGFCFSGFGADSILISANTYRAGRTSVLLSSPGYQCELPRHSVTLTTLRMAKNEVQAGVWSQVCAYAVGAGYDMASGSIYPEAGGSVHSNQPMVEVSWYDAVKWCNARSEQEGLVPVYYTDASQTKVYRKGEVDLKPQWVNWDAPGYRLPTEAEWETGSRGNIDGLILPWAQSSNQFSEVLGTSNANYEGSGTVPSGQYVANGYGVYDMGGNVSEWCWDWFDAGYYAESGTATVANLTGPQERPILGMRVTRGGSWFSGVEDCRCSARSGARPSDRNNFQGFRTVRKYYPADPSGVIVIRGADPIINWTEVSEAPGYEVWRCEMDSGVTNLLTTTTALVYKDTTAILHKKYSYYVRTVGAYPSVQAPEAREGHVSLDFDGDGKSEIGCYYPTSGSWYLFMSESTMLWTTNYAGGENTQPISGFFDSDNRCDFGTYSAPAGLWRISLSGGGEYANNFGFDGTFPITGDFDGDGVSDFGCYYPPNGGWFIFKSKTSQLWINNFGFDHTIPVTGDFDGDGIDDFGCYYPPNGGWFIFRSESASLWTANFGYSGTEPVTGDFDGDGITDFGCYDASSGLWFIFQSSTSSLWTTKFGFSGTTPIVGDYDGDGTDDFGCYYPPVGGWSIFKSSDGFWTTQFGYDGTTAVQ